MCLCQALFARLAEKDDAEELDHGEAGKRGDQRNRAGADRQQHVQVAVRQRGGEQEALQEQPFRDEAIERRDAGRGEHADQRDPGHPGHVMDQAAELAEIAFAGGVQDRAGGEEEQALEESVIEAVVERRRQGERGQVEQEEGFEDQRQTDADEDQPDVLDRRIGKQALHVVLHGRENYAEQRGGKAEDKQERTPAPVLHAQQIEAHAQQAVDRCLQHHAAHHRRDRRRRSGVCFRQPDMQGQQTGLGAEAEYGQEKGDRRPDAQRRERTHRVESVVAGAAGQDAEAKEDGQRAHMRDDQIKVSGAPDLGMPMLRSDEEERTERHRFPRNHEGVAVVSEEDEDDAGQETVIEQAMQAGLATFAWAEVTRRVDRDARRRGAEQGEEETGERVEAQVKRQIGQAERENAYLRGGSEAGQRDAGDGETDQCAERKEHPADQSEIVRLTDTDKTDRQPTAGGDHDQVKRRQFAHLRRYPQ